MDYDRSVALVGRPNVGKSRLFNRLAHRRISIVHDQPGVTRDIITAEVGDNYLLMDTGGLGLKDDSDFKKVTEAVEEQVAFAIGVAAVVIFVVDALAGIDSEDVKIAQMLRKHGKKVILVVNKVDHAGFEEKVKEFYRLGFGAPMCVSAEHGIGEAELVDAIDKALGPRPEKKEEIPFKKRRIKFALVGRPNVGKSSLGNRLLKMDRLIVSDVPGTTRESVQVHLDYTTKEGEVWPFELMDTAGLKHKTKVASALDYFSNLRTIHSFERADVVFQVIDAREGVTKLDKKLAGDIIELGNALVIVVNKWDYVFDSFKEGNLPTYEDEKEFRRHFEKMLRKELFFLPDSPVLFVSAKSNYAIEKIFYQARDLMERMQQKLATAQVNKVMHKLVAARTPRLVSGKRFKLYYAVQTTNRPFKIRLYCNRSDSLEPTYERYLQNEFIHAMNLKGCPVVFDLRGKNADEE